MTNDNLGSNIPAQIENLLTTKRLQFINLHGRFRGFDLELGADNDTGGQTRYVLELAIALGNLGIRVDIFTRLFEDVDSSYTVPLEEHGNVRIIRIRCGDSYYQRKELLWPVLEECVDEIIRFNVEQGIIPLAFHGHYSESGEIGRRLAAHFQVPLLFTGHSFGIPKREGCRAANMNMEDAETYYNFARRIEAETQVMRDATRIICNSVEEVTGQVRLYGNELVGKCRAIPPGVSTSFFPFFQEAAGSQAELQAISLIEPYLKDLSKPIILAVARPEPKKNLANLVRAFGKNAQLQQMANLVILAGQRNDLTDATEAGREVILELLCLEDKYELRGKLALPKKHSAYRDVPALHRVTARSRGVFVNIARTEPFGLTFLEAGASGNPILATINGGPPGIIRNCQNGRLVDPFNLTQIQARLVAMLSDGQQWEAYSTNGILGVEQHYSWNVHCMRYLELLSQIVTERE